MVEREREDTSTLTSGVVERVKLKKKYIIKSLNSPVDSDLHHFVWYVLVLTARETIKHIFNTSFSQKQHKTQNHAAVGRCNMKPRRQIIIFY